MFKLAAMFTSQGRTLASLFTALMLTACANPPTQADNIYINTTISGELMPGVYGQVNIGSVPDYVTVYEQPMIIVPQPVYAVPMQPIYLYVPPYHAYHWRDHCSYYNACARPVYFVCARDYRPHYFESRYYNTRVYDPPRVYHRHAGHNRHYETMHQREMNRDSRYHRVDGHKGPYYHENNGGHTNSYYRQNNDGKNHHYRHNEERRDEYRHDNNRHQQRDDRDKQPQRQQYINNQHNGGNGQQSHRQQYTTVQPPRNDAIRIRNDNYRPANYQPSNHGKHNSTQTTRNESRQTAYRPATDRVQTSDYRPRDRAQAPVQQSRQPSFNNSQNQQQRSFNRHQSGGQHERQREERR